MAESMSDRMLGKMSNRIYVRICLETPWWKFSRSKVIFTDAIVQCPPKIATFPPRVFCGSGLFHSFGLCSSHAGPPHEVPQPIFVNMFESYKSKGFKVGLGKRQKKKPITLNHAGFFPQAVSYGLITRNHAGYFYKKMRRQTYSRSCMSFYIIVRQTVLISWMDVVQVILCVA